MTSRTLDRDLVRVLRAVAHTNLSPLGAIASTTGMTVHEPLQVLRNKGYVREHGGVQGGGMPVLLYSITPKGKEALQALEIEPSDGMLSARAQGPSAPPTKHYDGAEMRPSTVRAGSMDAFKYPSRVGNSLHHVDGTVTKVDPAR
ncbi:hypothetical protein NU688_32930 [Variovorax sp. ZS18.2.2]|uniref:hypothetical protein n=1 Tax=Variovorax sp. ZS18.2.2 TaxID=2971255 RepID=UPI002150ACB9|nr:hypothetical protein [Variovorax sp. ZS18.2.2]MCR6481002.1 hypothetical protein [Variovorax sp. ZS18.2.2]